MKWRQAFGWLAVIAVATASAAAQGNVGAAAEAVTITAAPGGGVRMAKTVKRTYLGVATSPPSEALADQLKLPKGVGLLVDFVDAKSPAAAAGLRKNDVLMKLDDQLLANPAQLSALVRMRKPKDKVTLTLVREAEEQKVAAELGESEETTAELAADRIEWHTGGRVNLTQSLANPNFAWSTATAHTSSFSDGEHTLTVTTIGREKHLLAVDRDGNVLYSGPVNTEEQRKQVPPEILKKFQTMEQSMRVEGRGDGPVLRAWAGASGRSHTWSDDENNLTVTTRERGKYLTVDNRNGAILWQGPIQTDEQRKAVPPEFLPKLEKLEAKVREESRGTVSLIEDGLTVTLTTDAGKQTVVAKDADGKVLFEGPVDTEDQRAKMPAKIRTMLEKLWKTCAAVWQSSQENP